MDDKKDLTLRNIPGDVLVLLTHQAKKKGQSRNDYIVSILSKMALSNSTQIQQMLPEMIQYQILNILKWDEEKRAAYEAVQLSLIADCTSVLQQILLENDK